MQKLKGIFIGVFLVMLGYGAILTYAAWNTDLTVSSGDTLTSTKWNNVVENIETNSGAIAGLSGVSSIFTKSGNDAYYTGGSVGIGTTTPNSKLSVSTVNDNTEATVQIRAGSGNLARVLLQADNDSSKGFSIRSTINDKLDIIDQAGNELITFQDDGNVGIGTPSPSVKLEVNGNIIANDPIISAHVATKAYVDAQSGGLQVCSGTAASSGWQAHNGYSRYMDINTTSCGFVSTPRYFTSLVGSSGHWLTTGVTSVYGKTATGFRIYVAVQAWNNPTVANSIFSDWSVDWVAYGN